MGKEIIKIVENRIKRNKAFFNEGEMEVIQENLAIISKIYLLGIWDKSFN